MRHAKAGDLPGGPDAERALNPRGRRDAAAAGDWLRAHGHIPDLGAVLSRPARQADLAAGRGRAGCPVTVREDPRLYEAGSAELLGIIRDAPPDVATLMYVGHNPAARTWRPSCSGGPIDSRPPRSQ